MRILVFLVVSFVLTESIVDFSHSTLYDIFDFQGTEEVRISKCEYGCVIYASTMGKGFPDSPTDYDPYAQNLLIVDSNDAGSNISITDVSRQYKQGSLEKEPVVFTGTPKISVINTNGPKDAYWSIVLYVVEKAKADTLSYHVYDSDTMKDVTIDPNAIITVMSAVPFSVIGEKNGAPNSVTARLTGFDNALDKETDGCPVAFQSAVPSNSFAGFNLQMPSPIISLVCGQRNTFKMSATWDFIELQDLTIDRFIVSPGFNGCKKPNNGGIQNFRSPMYQYDDLYMLDTTQAFYNVTITTLPNLGKDSIVNIMDVEGELYTLNDLTAQITVHFPRTKHVEVGFQKMTGSNGFLLLHSAVPSTESTSVGPSASTTPLAATSTTTFAPTTSAFSGVEASLALLTLLASLLL